MKSTNITVEGDRNFVNAMAIIARQRKTTVAALVREALNKTFKKDLDEVLPFFEDRAPQKHQTMQGRSKEGAA